MCLKPIIGIIFDIEPAPISDLLFDDCVNSGDMFVINRDPLSPANAFVIENRILFVDSKRKSIFTRMDELVSYDDYKKNKTKNGIHRTHEHTHTRKLTIEKSFMMQTQTKDDSNFGFFIAHFLKNEGKKSSLQILNGLFC